MPKAGYLTPSRFSDILVNGKKAGAFGEGAKTYAFETVAGMLGIARDEMRSKATDWGNAYEFAAVRAYEEHTFKIVQRGLEFEYSKDYPTFIGGTADGLVEDTEGGCDAKCPYNPVNHLRNLLDGFQLATYKAQFQGYMWIYEKEWWDMISFDPMAPDPLKLNINRIYRDDAYIKILEARCIQFYFGEVLPLYEQVQKAGEIYRAA